MSMDIYNELLEAGAPPLPEGRRYEITHVNNSVKVAITTERNQLAYEFVFLEKYEVLEDGTLKRGGWDPVSLISLIASAARRAYQEVAANEVESSRLSRVRGEVERLEGTHP